MHGHALHDSTPPSDAVLALFSEAPQAVLSLEGPDFRVAWANRAAIQMAMYQVPQLEGCALRELGTDSSALVALVEAAASTGKDQPFAHLRVAGRAGPLWLTGVVTPFEGRVVLQARDASAEVRKLDDGVVCDQVLEQVPLPMLLLSAGGELIRANNRARTRLGVRTGMQRDEIAAAMDLQDADGTCWAPDEAPLDRLLAGELLELRGSIVDRLLGERRDCILHGGPVRTGSRVDACVLTMIDVTEMRRLERAQDEFINVAGHELKTPLTAARTFLQLAVRKGLDDPQAGSLVDSAIAATHRMARLINDILDTARLETGRIELRLERRDLGATIEDQVDRLRGQLGGERRILMDIAEPLPVEHDPVRIDQVVDNLLSNALRFSPEDSPVRVSARAEKGCAVVEVEDSGAGIPPEEERWVFDRLYRGPSAPGDGLGLGLFIAKLLVELHGGRIGVAPRPGLGARFFFCIPLAG